MDVNKIADIKIACLNVAKEFSTTMEDLVKNTKALLELLRLE